MGALVKFSSLQKRIERGEWLTTTPVWVDRPAPKEEGLIKLDRSRNGTRLGIGVRCPVQNSGFEAKLRVMDIFGELITVSCKENLCCPLSADSREICLRYNYKGECIRCCRRSHVPLQGQARYNLIRFIG